MSRKKYTREPPEGVLAGEDVPIENDRDELREDRVRELARKLRERPAFQDTPSDERQRIARRKLRKWGDK